VDGDLRRAAAGRAAHREPRHRASIAGAPEKPQLLRKAIICTAISAVLWCVWYVVWVYDVFSFRK
jgi:predicted secreted protein